MTINASEEDHNSPESLRRCSRISSITSGNSSVTNNTIPADFIQIWSQLPDEIRLDPSLIVFKKEYEQLEKFPSTSINISHQKIAEYDCKKDNEYSGNKLKAPESKFTSIVRYVKLTLLVSCWIAFTIILMMTKEKNENTHFISVPNYEIKNMPLIDGLYSDRISVTVEGSILSETNKSFDLNFPQLSIWLELLTDTQKFSDNHLITDTQIKNISEEWILPLIPPELADFHPNQRRMKTFELKKLDDRPVAINLRTNSNLSIPISLSYDLTPIDVNKGLALGAFVLIGLYILIMFELVHRTLAALLAATSSIAILAALNEKPTVSQITSWVDFDTIMLLFSMMVLVAIVADTGTFDYFAAFAYKVSKGKVLPLVSMLCFFTAFVSAFLDNVTVIMLIIPITIRLCEVIQLNPVPVITLMVMFSNIGGAMTPVGDPPNVIIASNRRVIAAGVGFSTFTLHMGIGVLLALIILYGHFRFIFRNLDKLRTRNPQDNQELRNEITRWQNAVSILTSHNEGDLTARNTLLNKVREILDQLENKLTSENDSTINYQTTVKEMSEKYRIRDKWLLVKSGICMMLVIILFFLHSSPNFHLSIGSTAFLGVLLLLILADNKSFDDLLARVEWSTLLFFAALFILMEALTELGLISWIGNQTELIIMSVSEESRLAVAILLLLWVSAFAGALVDNVPLTTMMIRIVTGIAENSKLQLPLQPLVWALAFGACMGGNGTLIGATTNVVCAGVAEKHGYHVTFMQFFKMGFPVLLTSTLTISVYLMVAHVVFEWNY